MIEVLRTIFIMYCVSLHEYDHINELPSETGVSDPLELDLWAVVSYLIWMLGSELWSSGRVLCVLNM